MGWTLIEYGWTMSNTSRVTCLGPHGPQKMVPGGSRGPKNGHIQPMMAIFSLWGPPVPLSRGPEGPNRSPWMCLTMSNLVQPMPNRFGAVGGSYGRKWPFLAKYGPFWGLWVPPVPLFGGP